MSIGIALLIASHFLLHDDAVRTGGVYGPARSDNRWDVTMKLDVGPTGVATLSIMGSNVWSSYDPTPHGAPASMGATSAINETWIGLATVGASALVIRFNAFVHHGLPEAVDVAWRCDSSPVLVSGTSTTVWRCGPAQNTPIPGGPGALPTYFETSTQFAAPPVSLRVTETAHTGTDGRMHITSSALSR